MADEWYTPADVVEAARTAMGGIDLDPASCEVANCVVRARRYWTIDDDGTRQPWFGRVWCNPPYSREAKAKFMEKVSVEKFRVAALCLLLNADTSTSFPDIAKDAQAIAMIDRRLRFTGPGGHNNRFLSVVYYYGDDPERFSDAFSQIATVVLGTGPMMDPELRRLARWSVARDCLHCGTRVPQACVGRRRHFCGAACRVAFNRAWPDAA